MAGSTGRNFVPQEVKFKTNLLLFFDDLITIYSDKNRNDLVNYCNLVKGISDKIEPETLISKFITQIDVKRDDNTTIREEYASGNFFSLLLKFVDSLPLGKGVLKDDDFDNLDDEEKNILVTYVKSFFKIVEKYSEEKNGSSDKSSCSI